MARTEQAREVLLMIQAELDDHINIDPERVNWVHVVDAQHVMESLKDIARFMGHAE